MSNNPQMVLDQTDGTTPFSQAMSDAWFADESEHLATLYKGLQLSEKQQQDIVAMATSLVTRVRAKQSEQGGLDAFMQQYDLSSEEGILLMCLAEALLRIPDADTADKLIADKLGDADFESHLGKSDSLFVNASTWGLMLTGQLVTISENRLLRGLKKLLTRSGEPVIRQAMRSAMRVMGHQYVLGRTIEEALKKSNTKEMRHYRFSYDMLGEAALTADDASRYHKAYLAAIGSMSAHVRKDMHASPSISIKLSALHPRYEIGKRQRVLSELTPRILELALAARNSGVAVTIDAEEADRLQLSLELFTAVFENPALSGWNGMGLVVQAYQKRAPVVIRYLADLARRHGRSIPVRLVKGAYWDTEIKHAQVEGLPGFPVFTRKANTDVSYQYCARLLLAEPDCFYPQFATHNAQTVAAIHQFASEGQPFEFQRLHGMGEELYDEIVSQDDSIIPCRVYAPVGSHEDLLPYLVRRLLENGANTSFVNRIVDNELPISEIVQDPIELSQHYSSKPHPGIRQPADLYRRQSQENPEADSGRTNSQGANLADEIELARLKQALEKALQEPCRISARVSDMTGRNRFKPDKQAKWLDITNPANRNQVVGQWLPVDDAQVRQALDTARDYFPQWSMTSVDHRADCLERAADLLEQHRDELMALLISEAGKTLPDAVAEIREAVDFCRYYARQATLLMAEPQAFPGPSAESNSMTLHGKGPFVCISPWNFPLAIFLGQVAAALVAGNTVLAKPAEQTAAVADRATALMHEAGIPLQALQCLPGDGARVGAALVGDPAIAGVAFTGSTATAHLINRTLAGRDGPIATLIAETGGMNAMIADSSCLPEQLVNDVISSAFHSAGQRCSAMRILYIQEDIADKVITMLAGAMDELSVGNPAMVSTDVGPVIDDDALAALSDHCRRLDELAAAGSGVKVIRKLALDETTGHGSFLPPVAYELDSQSLLDKEVFGPVLHVIRYRARDIDEVLQQINGTGYGLTLGVHSRIESFAEQIAKRARVGNVYVNRNMVGAVVGVQPFGGEGLSGTGPKAGGPHYLLRLVNERTLTINTAAVGGNADLLALEQTRE